MVQMMRASRGMSGPQQLGERAGVEGEHRAHLGEKAGTFVPQGIAHVNMGRRPQLWC